MSWLTEDCAVVVRLHGVDGDCLLDKNASTMARLDQVGGSHQEH